MRVGPAEAPTTYMKHKRNYAKLTSPPDSSFVTCNGLGHHIIQSAHFDIESDCGKKWNYPDHFCVCPIIFLMSVLCPSHDHRIAVKSYETMGRNLLGASHSAPSHIPISSQLWMCYFEWWLLHVFTQQK